VPGVVGVNLRDEVHRAGGPAIAVHADQAEPDDLAVHLDEEGLRR